MTRREEIEGLLKQRPWTPKELADHFGVTIPEIIEDLGHVKRGAQASMLFKYQPPVCNSCGFLFKERIKLKTPTKCPRCRKEDISEARYFIRQD